MKINKLLIVIILILLTGCSDADIRHVVISIPKDTTINSIYIDGFKQEIIETALDGTKAATVIVYLTDGEHTVTGDNGNQTLLYTKIMIDKKHQTYLCRDKIIKLTCKAVD